jgi:hypothetical protein
LLIQGVHVGALLDQEFYEAVDELAVVLVQEAEDDESESLAQRWCKVPDGLQQRRLSVKGILRVDVQTKAQQDLDDIAHIFSIVFPPLVVFLVLFKGRSRAKLEIGFARCAPAIRAIPQPPPVWLTLVKLHPFNEPMQSRLSALRIGTVGVERLLVEQRFDIRHSSPPCEKMQTGISLVRSRIDVRSIRKQNCEAVLWVAGVARQSLLQEGIDVVCRLNYNASAMQRSLAHPVGRVDFSILFEQQPNAVQMPDGFVQRRAPQLVLSASVR